MNAIETTPTPVPAPVGILAELTHRCPLGCPYCSNPIELESRAGELDTETWMRVFSEAAAVGILHAHLSGGEPASRRDLVEIVAHCAKVGLYTNLITSGIGLTQERVRQLADAGLDHVQLSIQDALPEFADKIAGYKGAFARKIEVAKWVNEVGHSAHRQCRHPSRQYRSRRPHGRIRRRTWRASRRDRAYAILRLGARSIVRR